VGTLDKRGLLCKDGLAPRGIAAMAGWSEKSGESMPRTCGYLA
jgi:hypothetical protein